MLRRHIIPSTLWWKSVRRKIEPAGGKPHYLLNSYGVGYRLNLVAKRTE